ncbi:MAG: hypothetical protein ACOXZT_04510 [Tissierellaceae bacterium]|jgi:hypothetical protein
MIIQVYQSETDEYKEMESIGKLKYVGESFGVDSLTDGKSYDVIEVMTDDLIRVVDDSEEDYLYSIYNPRPLDESSQGGKWEIVEDYIGNLEELMKKNAYKPNN